MKAAYNEFERILRAIEQLKESKQIIPTYNWIRLFEKRFKCSDLACMLISKLNDKQLN